MALQRCRECDGRVSTEAPYCPHCGAPDPAPAAPPPAVLADPPAEAVATADSAEWRYLHGDRQHGPHTRRELMELLGSGEISPDTRVKSDAMPYWMPVKTVPELHAGGATRGSSPPQAARAPSVPARRAPSPASIYEMSSAAKERERPDKTAATVGYALQLAGFLAGVSLLVAVVIAYMKRDDVEGTWLHAHFQWQINTFWYLALWVAAALFLGMVLGLSAVGFGVVWFPSALFLIYRVVHGWLRLNDGERV
jgi:uncharacterized membrane protein